MVDVDFNSYDYFTNDYYVFRKDRTYTPNLTRGGGTLIVVRKSFKVFRRFDSDFNDIECVWLQLKINSETTLLIGNHYFAPLSQVDLLQRYSDFLFENVDTVSFKVIFIGDFNLPKFDWDLGLSSNDNYYIKRKSDVIYTLISILNLVQKNSVKLYPDDNLLDLIFTNFDDELIVTNASNSLVKVDHQHPCIHTTISVPSQLFNDNFVPFTKLNFSKGDYFGLYNYISNHTFSTSDSIVEVVSDLTDTINHAISNYIPVTTVKPSRYPCWFSRKLIDSLHK